jgi:type IV pilus assembly protein PilC
MLVKVIPTFEKMYHDMGNAELPAATRVVINISHSFVNSWYLFAGALFGAVAGVIAMRRSDGGREISDAFLLRLPVIGPTLRKIVVARFTRTLGTLLASGVPILDALEICSRTAGNRVVSPSRACSRAWSCR